MADNIKNSGDAENPEDRSTPRSPENLTKDDQQADPNRPAEDPDPVQTLTQQVAAAEATAREHYDRLLRVTAEFENYKKRSARDLGDFRKYATESLLKDLLPVVDNLERALETCDASDGAGAIREGVALTLKDLLKLFEKSSVEVVASLGKPFDPMFHQAVMRAPGDGAEENTVIRELQKGYTLHGRLLRPAMVIVAAAAGDPPAEH